MVNKQQLVELMVKHPERVGRSSFRIGDRIVFTVTKELVEWSTNRKFRWPVKKQTIHRSFLMPAEVPAISDPHIEGWYFEQVAEEIAEKSVTHTLRGFWQKRVAEAFELDPSLIVLIGYKVVAVKDGKHLSLYDGSTEYKLGERLEQPAQRGHQGGFYVLENISDCNGGDIPLPTNAVLRRWPHRAILRVEYGGKTISYGGKVAASWVRPTHVVTTRF